MIDRPFNTGDLFFRTGDVSEAAYCIKSGQVEILFGDVANPTRVVLLGPTEVFGEMALVEERPHSATARAVTSGVVSRMDRAQFEQMLLQDPARCRAYLRSLFERLRQLSAAIVDSTPPGSLSVAPSSTKPKAKLRATLFGVTRRAVAAIPDGGLNLNHFPFRVGRKSESDEKQSLDINDLWLEDRRPYCVSRNHLAIEQGPDGGFVVRDRGSHLGTVVNDAHIGGKMSRLTAPLVEGDNVVGLGGSHTSFQFRVTVDHA